MDNQDILLGTSFPLPEVDDEENDDAPERAFNTYNCLEITNNIGKEDFKEIFQYSIIEIIKLDLKDQIIFCENILQKIEEVYDFLFPFKLEIYDLDRVDKIYHFLEFLEYDHIDFLALVWKKIRVDIRQADLNQYKNEKLIKAVEEVAKENKFSKLINVFLITYEKEKMLDFIVEKTERSRMLVYLKIMEGEYNV